MLGVLLNHEGVQGLSCTALKKVCRKMGVPNWPYRYRDELSKSPVSSCRSSSMSPPRSPISPHSRDARGFYEPRHRLESEIPPLGSEEGGGPGAGSESHGMPGGGKLPYMDGSFQRPVNGPGSQGAHLLPEDWVRPRPQVGASGGKEVGEVGRRRGG